MSDKLRWPTFWALLGVFILTVCLFAIPSFGDLFSDYLFMLPFLAMFLLGVALVVLTARGNIGLSLQTFFSLAGVSAAVIFVAIVVHNAIAGIPLFYDWASGWWSSGDEAVSLIAVMVICPLGFLVGAVGAIALGIKGLKSHR